MSQVSPSKASLSAKKEATWQSHRGLSGACWVVRELDPQVIDMEDLQTNCAVCTCLRAVEILKCPKAAYLANSRTSRVKGQLTHKLGVQKACFQARHETDRCAGSTGAYRCRAVARVRTAAGRWLRRIAQSHGRCRGFIPLQVQGTLTRRPCFFFLPRIPKEPNLWVTRPN